MAKPPKSKTGGAKNAERRNGKAWKRNKELIDKRREDAENSNAASIAQHFGNIQLTQTRRRKFLYG
jgi:hypothetical protein